MNGPEHYRESERLIASRDQLGDTAGVLSLQALLLLADVHATLALAAATALNQGDTGLQDRDYIAWREVASDPVPNEPSAR